jgi:CRISPR/Cas system-associated exonuclease Cas4 (RecB family)
MISLSWSRLSSYNQCPRKFHLQFITKSFPEEEKSIHLIKGEQLHKQLEDYVIAKNGGAAMPLGFSPEVRETLPYVDKLFALYSAVYPEAQVSAGRDWKPLEWFDKSTMYRAIWDVVALRDTTCFIGDYKSGKVYPYGSTYGQLHLSAVIALNRFPEVPEVNAAYIYIEHKKVHPIKVTRTELPQVQAHFEAEFEKVQKEVNWDPTPNEFCKWCPATKAQCKFSRKL